MLKKVEDSKYLINFVFRQVVAKRDLPANPRQVTPLRARPDATYDA